jgi:hypothetical protein
VLVQFAFPLLWVIAGALLSNALLYLIVSPYPLLVNYQFQALIVGVADYPKYENHSLSFRCDDEYPVRLAEAHHPIQTIGGESGDTDL